MTCVAAYIDGEVVVMTSDSASIDTEGFVAIREPNSKVWKASIGTEDILVGFSGDFGVGSYIHHSFQWPIKHFNECMFTYFSRSLEILEKTICRRFDKKDLDWALLIGAGKQLFTLAPGGYIETTVEKFAAIGSGETIAKGALFILQHTTEPSWRKLEECLIAASHFDSSVRRPFCTEYLMK